LILNFLFFLTLSATVAVILSVRSTWNPDVQLACQVSFSFVFFKNHFAFSARCDLADLKCAVVAMDVHGWL
jgi:hypothetical protein